MTVRSVSPALAPLLELLELEQPRVLSTAQLSRLASQAGVDWPVNLVVRRLRERGWLLPLATRGVWEFAPAARAGAYGAGDPFIELRAVLARDPGSPLATAAESAAFMLGLSSRRPEREVIVAPPGVRLPKSLKAFRLVRWRASLPAVLRDDVPVWSEPTLLAFMATRPAGYRDWPNVGEWLAQAARQIPVDDLARELAQRPAAAWARAAYLLRRGGEPDRAAILAEHAPRGTGPFYLGDRRREGCYDRVYDVVDSTGLGSGTR